MITVKYTLKDVAPDFMIQWAQGQTDSEIYISNKFLSNDNVTTDLK